MSRIIDLDSWSRAVVCIDDDGLQDAIEATLGSVGFEDVDVIDRGLTAIDRAAIKQPRVAVIDMTASGQFGTRLISALRSVAPGCVVVVISPLDGLDDALTAVGAHAVLRPDDLRGLDEVLRGLITPGTSR